MPTLFWGIPRVKRRRKAVNLLSFPLHVRCHNTPAAQTSTAGSIYTMETGKQCQWCNVLGFVFFPPLKQWLLTTNHHTNENHHSLWGTFTKLLHFPHSLSAGRSYPPHFTGETSELICWATGKEPFACAPCAITRLLTKVKDTWISFSQQIKQILSQKANHLNTGNLPPTLTVQCSSFFSSTYLTLLNQYIFHFLPHFPLHINPTFWYISF